MTKTQIRQVTDQEAVARACRHCSVGDWVVERWHALFGGRYGEEKGYFIEVSSHISEGAAQKALAKLDRKLAKGTK